MAEEGYDIKIEKGIPVPQRGGGKGYYAAVRKALTQMDIGDSFLLPITNGQKLASQRTAVKILAKELGVPTATKEEGGNLRVWRVAEKGSD